MTILYLIWGLSCLGECASVSPTLRLQEHWAGRVAVGPIVYALTAEITDEGDGVIRLSLKMSPRAGGAVRSIVAVLGSHAEVTVDGRGSRPLTPEIAAEWRRQLATGLGAAVSSNDYDCRTVAKQRICDSRAIVPLDDSLSGRLRLIYNGNRLAGVRFFSLAEWTNPFGEYLSLSLDIQ